MTQGLAGIGADIKLGSTSSPGSTSITFTTIAEVEDVTGPSETLNLAEVLTHDSTYMERVATHLDGGEVTFDVVTVPGDVTQGATAGLKNLQRNKTKRVFRQFFSSTSSRHKEFVAFVSQAEDNLPVDEVIRTSFTLAIDGSVSQSTST